MILSVSDAVAEGGGDPPDESVSRLRLASGRIGAAVIRELDAAGRPLSVREIHRGVEERLEQTVAYSSTRNVVARLVRCGEAPIVRVDLGVYALSDRDRVS